MGLYGIGISGLNAASAGLATTSHNISNANTPGFSRQSTIQATALPQFTGAGFFGSGVDIAAVVRSYSGFLDTQAREAQSQAGGLGALQEQLESIDRLLSDAQSGLAPVLDDFFAAAGTVAANPSDLAARQSFVSASATVAARFRGIGAQLDGLREGANLRIGQSVDAINSAGVQIALLNDRISLALSTGGGTPNDLMDTRDALLRELAGEVRVSTVAVANGGVNVFLSNGQPLVVDARSFALAARTDPADAANLAVGTEAGGVFSPFNESAVAGGALGGTLAFRTQGLDLAQNSLGRIALAMSEAVNAQHAMGVDRNGAVGGAVFAVIGPQVLGNSGNAGNAMIAAVLTSQAALTTSDYRLVYDGANYSLTRLADNTQQTFATLPQTVDGVAITLASGSAAAGDSFLIRPTRMAAGNVSALVTDPARVAAALPVRAAIAIANAGSGSLRVTTTPPPAGVNLTQPVTITFTSATTFNVSGAGTGNPVGLTYIAGMTLSYNGWNADLTGAPASGDTFTVGPNVNGSGDNGNMRALAALQTARLLAGGSASLADAYALAVADVGSQTRATRVAAQAQDAILTQARGAREAVSGVNLDEEAANLLKYQQAYQAAGKVIATANALFDEILSIMR